MPDYDSNIIIFFQQLPRGPTNFVNKNLSGFIYAQQVQAGTTQLGGYFLRGYNMGRYNIWEL